METALKRSTNETASSHCLRFASGFSSLKTNHVRALSGSVAAFNPQRRGVSYRASGELASYGRKRISVEFGTSGETGFDSRKLNAVNRNHQSKKASLFVEGIGQIPVGGGNEK